MPYKRKSSRISAVEIVVLVIILAVIGYVVLPRFISFEPEIYQAEWEHTKQGAKHFADKLSEKEMFDAIEEATEDLH